MVAALLRWLLGRMSTPTSTLVGDAKGRYQTELDQIADKAERAQDALGAVLFIAGQHLAVVAHLKDELKKAQKGLE